MRRYSLQKVEVPLQQEDMILSKKFVEFISQRGPCSARNESSKKFRIVCRKEIKYAPRHFKRCLPIGGESLPGLRLLRGAALEEGTG